MSKDAYVGQTLNERYRLQRLLGQGGMGAVYLARHLLIGRQVAVKILSEEFAANSEMIVRFYREAQAATLIHHPNVIEIFDVGVTSHGAPFIVMDYLEGESLAALLSRLGRLDLPAALGVLEPVLEALTAVHEKGVIHRDLKPHNVFLVCQPGEPPQVKLIDFGLSKMVVDQARSRLTKNGAMLGTPQYMSPEQARGTDTIDVRCDTYAVGVMLYELLTGALPFEAESYQRLLVAIASEPARSPLVACPQFPLEALPIVDKALAKRADERYQSAAEMLRALSSLSGFEHRHQALAELEGPGARLSVATGSLGAPPPESAPDFAAEYLAKMLREQTPTGSHHRPSHSSAETVVDPAAGSYLALEPSPVKGRAAPKSRWLAISAFAITGIVVAGFALWWGREHRTAPLTPASAPPAARSVEQPGTVQITVVGVPLGARITCGGQSAPGNPFPFPRGRATVPLKVELAGYEPFAVSIVPAADLVIRVELHAVAAATTLPDTGAPVEARQPVAPAAAAAPGARGNHPPKALKKGDKGADFVEEFE